MFHDERIGLSFIAAAGPHQFSYSRVLVLWTHDRILPSQIQDFPNLEGQVPIFISPRNRVVQLHPQALGSLSITSCDSQGYGGYIRTSHGVSDIASEQTQQKNRFQ
jgi:hypothetical protein